jgi:hypothetical protein
MKRSDLMCDISDYKLYLNKYKSMIVKKQKKYYDGLFIDAGNDSKKKWHIVKSIMGRNDGIRHIAKIKDDNGIIINDDVNIAKTLNKHFATIGKKINNKMRNKYNNQIQNIPILTEEYIVIDDEDNHVPNTNESDCVNDINSFKIEKVYPYDIIKITKSMKSNMTNSLIEVPSKLLHENIRSLAYPIAIIANASIEQGVFPDQYKKSTITPIYKGKGTRENVNNYRPISVTKFISKLLERIIKIQLNYYMEKNDLYSNCQFGFREGLSTELALINFQNIIMKNQNENCVTLAVFIDLEKAFDCVEHSDVLNELNLLNFSDNAIKWFRSYLSSRTHRVKINKVLSDFLDSDIGCPQGTVLSAQIFLIIINSLLTANRDYDMVAFADDCAIIFKIKPNEFNEEIVKINGLLSVIDGWFIKHRLSINIEKTKAILFQTHQRGLNTRGVDLRFGTDRIELVDSIRYLGVIVESNFSNKKHIDMSISRCTPIILALAEMRSRGICREALISVYHSMFMSTLCYAISVWGGFSLGGIKRVQVAQNNAIRAITGISKYETVRTKMRELNIMCINDIYKIEILKLGYKMVNNHLKHDLSLELIFNKNNGTRLNYPLIPPNTRFTLFQNSTSYTMITEWNDLEESIRNSKSFNIFKDKIKKSYLGQ